MLARILPFKNDKAHIPIPTSSFAHSFIHPSTLLAYLLFSLLAISNR